MLPHKAQMTEKKQKRETMSKRERLAFLPWALILMLKVTTLTTLSSNNQGNNNNNKPPEFQVIDFQYLATRILDL